MDTFRVTPGFCPLCGSIFPIPKLNGMVECYTCKSTFTPDVFGEQKIEFTLNFNTYDPENFINATNKETTAVAASDDGPLVERKCSKCGHNKMSYATLQLRSADEGQTVFFTCIKCRFKESENS